MQEGCPWSLVQCNSKSTPQKKVIRKISAIIVPLVSKILTNRLEKILDENQPREQAGFRSGYSIMDHLHTMNQLIKKTSEYNIPLCLAFVDYEKAFGSVERAAISNALYEQGINETYIKLIENTYANGTSVVRLQKDTEKVKIGKRVTEGDTNLPKLFTDSREGVFRELSWESKGISIDGNILPFSDLWMILS